MKNTKNNKAVKRLKSKIKRKLKRKGKRKLKKMKGKKAVLGFRELSSRKRESRIIGRASLQINKPYKYPWMCSLKISGFR